MVESLYYDDKNFEAIDGNMVLVHLAGEKLGGDYKAEEKQYIEQIQKQLRGGSRIISYHFKQDKERCGCCNKLLHRGDLQYFCPNCGIPFRRTRCIIQQEDGKETTTFRPPPLSFYL